MSTVVSTGNSTGLPDGTKIADHLNASGDKVQEIGILDGEHVTLGAKADAAWDGAAASTTGMSIWKAVWAKLEAIRTVLAGTLSIGGSVSVTNLPGTQPVSGTVAVSNFPGSQAVTGPLTDTQLRATAVPVSGPLTDTQLRATAVPVSGPLTDTQLRATAVPVSMAANTPTLAAQGAAGNSPHAVVSLGNSLGKTNIGKTGALASSATTANQVIVTYTVTALKTLYLSGWDAMARLTTFAATATLFGTVSLRIGGVVFFTWDLAGPGIDKTLDLSFVEPIPIPAGTVVDIVCTPAAATAISWKGNLKGYEK